MKDRTAAGATIDTEGPRAPDAPLSDPGLVEEVRRALLDFYDRHARELPWRRDRDPYRVLVSEIMLQQTRVETVTGYYDPWLERFPTLESLADADEDQVLKAWEGLGYYRRARNLHRAARVVREEWGGTLPDRAETLRELPGIGEYTAGAVASIAFGEAVPAVDGNVKRVLARLADVPDPKPAWLRDTAGRLVDPERPGAWNQALMELGATVCTPRSPGCDACPLARWCAARAAGTQLERPAPKEKRPVPEADIALAVVHDGERVLLAKRPPEGLLAGMWAFPEARLDPPDGARPDGGSPGGRPAGNSADTRGDDARRAHAHGADAARRAALMLADGLGLEPVAEPVALPECLHRFTHLQARYLPWAIRVDDRGRAGPGTAWVDPARPGTRALPRAQQRVLASWLERRGGEG